MSMFLQQLFNGLSIGSVYALMAVGYSLIYSLLNFTNFAHSITVTLGAFATFYFMTILVQNLYLGIIVAILISGVVAVLIELLSYRPLLKKNARRIYLLIAGLGVQTMCENLIIVTFSSRFHAYPVNLSLETMDLFGITIGIVDVAIFAVSMVALIAVEFYVQKSRSGLAIRGASFNLDAAAIMGVNVQKLILTVFMIAGGLAGLAGALSGAKYTAYPTLGSSMTNKAFISSVFGGLGSLPGAMIGAIILGVAETMISGYVSSELRDVFSYTLLVVVLFVRPHGLMGKPVEDKA